MQVDPLPVVLAVITHLWLKLEDLLGYCSPVSLPEHLSVIALTFLKTPFWLLWLSPTITIAASELDHNPKHYSQNSLLLSAFWVHRIFFDPTKLMLWIFSVFDHNDYAFGKSHISKKSVGKYPGIAKDRKTTLHTDELDFKQPMLQQITMAMGNL